MTSTEEIRKRLRELGAGASFRAELAEVTAVNETAKTCEVKLLANDLELVNVRLTADIAEDDDNYCVQVPKVGSSVVVAQLSAAFWFVLIFGDLEKVMVKNVTTEMVLEEGKITAKAEELVINGGENGGLVNVAELTKILNALNSALTGIKSVLSTPVITAGPGQPDLLHAALNSALAAVSPVQVTDSLIDNKVKH